MTTVENLSIRQQPRRQSRQPRICIICDAEIINRNVKVCGADCKQEMKRRYQAQWERDNAEKRKAYYAEYYARNKENKSTRARVNYRIRKNTPGWPETSRLRGRIERKRRFLVRKVMREWGVCAQQAREWIKQGTFPP